MLHFPLILENMSNILHSFSQYIEYYGPLHINLIHLYYEPCTLEENLTRTDTETSSEVVS